MIEEVLRHEAPRGRGLAAEGEPPIGEHIEPADVGNRFDAGVDVGDEHGVEVLVDVALGDDLRAWRLQAGLHAGQPAEPHEVEVADAEQVDGSRVLGDRHVLDVDAELGAQVVRHQAMLAGQLLRSWSGIAPTRSASPDPIG